MSRARKTLYDDGSAGVVELDEAAAVERNDGLEKVAWSDQNVS